MVAWKMQRHLPRVTVSVIELRSLSHSLNPASPLARPLRTEASTRSVMAIKVSGERDSPMTKTAVADTMINPASAPPTMMKRLVSLDVVRGITIAFMIMVNNNGGPGSWHFMNHAEWNGLTPTDLVFPTFAFVIGVSVVFAFEARLARGAKKAQLAVHTAQRAVILIIFGIIVNSFPYFHLAH